MEVEPSSRAPAAFRKSFNALFGTIVVLSLFVSIAIPEARLFSGCLLAAYLVKTVTRVLNSEDRRDEFWKIAREIGLAARVILAVALALAAFVALAWYASRP